ncbi:unnamed protein product [Boreogadus saida]
MKPSHGRSMLAENVADRLCIVSCVSVITLQRPVWCCMGDEHICLRDDMWSLLLRAAVGARLLCQHPSNMELSNHHNNSNNNNNNSNSSSSHNNSVWLWLLL